MTLNSMRVWFGHYAKWIMGFMFVAMVVTTFSWNGLGRGNGPATPAQSPDDVVATVDGQQVTRGDIDQQMDRMEQQFGGGSVPLMEMPFIQQYALQQVEQGDEMVAKAKKMGITASDAEIQQERDKILVADHARQELGLPANASLADVDAALEQQGKSVETLFPDADLAESIIMQKLQDRITKGITVSEQDTRNSYTQYHTQHILVDAQKRSDLEAQARAKQIIAMASKPGADFSALAKQDSDEFGTKNKGGDAGWIDQSTSYLPQEYKQAAFALHPGQVTPDPVKSAQYNGYFIIKLDGTRSNLPADFDKKKATYISQYSQTKQNQAWTDFTTELQSEPHKIVMLDPALRGSQEMQDAQKLPSTDPNQQTLYRKAIADFQKAVKNASGRDKAVLYLQIATADSNLKDLQAELAAYQAANKANGTPDTQLLMAIGDLYKQMGQNDQAVAEYQAASKNDWNDMSTHRTLVADYNAMGHKDLAAQELAWIANYQKTHPQPKTPALGMGGPGGAQPIQVSTSGKTTAQPIVVKTVPGKSTAHPIAVSTSTGKSTAQPIVIHTTGAQPASQQSAPTQ